MSSNLLRNVFDIIWFWNQFSLPKGQRRARWPIGLGADQREDVMNLLRHRIDGPPAIVLRIFTGL